MWVSGNMYCYCIVCFIGSVALVFGDIIIEKSILAARHSYCVGNFLNWKLLLFLLNTMHNGINNYGTYSLCNVHYFHKLWTADTYCLCAHISSLSTISPSPPSLATVLPSLLWESNHCCSNANRKTSNILKMGIFLKPLWWWHK